MSLLDTPSTSSMLPASKHRRPRTLLRRCERGCCSVASYFPLACIYSLTTWAAYVEADLGLSSTGTRKPTWSTKPSSLLAICLYLLLNLSYTVAVFTDPGSPSRPRQSTRKDHRGYSHLPTTEPSPHRATYTQPITVSSTGSPRYCKKCHHTKPDRTHHCSTCRRCVLKMDHHCPWLATCLGLHNYKPFVLFLIYTSLFCWVCFASTAYWVWEEVLSDAQYLQTYMPINVVLLAIISGVIGLVLTGFTCWHLWLCVRGTTTIECLEKTRYLRAVRSRVERQRVEALQHSRHPDGSQQPHGVQETLRRAGEAVLEFHANAVPGATRLEEGEEKASPTSRLMRGGPTFQMPAQPDIHHHGPAQANAETMTPAQSSLVRTYASNYASRETERERDRYEDYLAEQESSKLPNAFDLGWRRNLSHIFGPKSQWYLWLLPVTNTSGDGWRWAMSDRWIEEVERLALTRGNTDRHHHDYRDHNDRHHHQQNHPAVAEARLRGGHGYPYNDDGGDQSQDQRPDSQTGMSMRTLQFDRHHHRQPAPDPHHLPLSSSPAAAATVTRNPNSTTETNSNNNNLPGHRQKRHDVDYAEDGQMDSFQVSSSSEDDGDGVASFSSSASFSDR